VPEYLATWAVLTVLLGAWSFAPEVYSQHRIQLRGFLYECARHDGKTHAQAVRSTWRLVVMLDGAPVLALAVTGLLLLAALG
jgi:hypothetical protein